jgi:hypothetical protein
MNKPPGIHNKKVLVMTKDEQSLSVELVPGRPCSHEFTLRVTPEYVDELGELLRENGLYRGRVIEISEPVTLLEAISVVVGDRGALTKLADVLLTFIGRQESKEIRLCSRISEWKVTGHPRRDVDRLVETTANLQEQRDARTNEVRDIEEIALPDTFL